MKNILAEDRSVREVCEEILLGSYPYIAKQLAAQLIEALNAISIQSQSARESE